MVNIGIGIVFTIGCSCCQYVFLFIDLFENARLFALLVCCDGAIVSVVYDTLGKDTITYCVNHADIKIVLCGASKLAVLKDCIAEVNFVVVVGVVVVVDLKLCLLSLSFSLFRSLFLSPLIHTHHHSNQCPKLEHIVVFDSNIVERLPTKEIGNVKIHRFSDVNLFCFFVYECHDYQDIFV
jgi:hypothetical protein